MNYKHTLDPTPRKFICPSCGKKRFVRYTNTETGEYLPIEYGRCDRETSCAYHLKPNFSCHPERSEGSPLKYSPRTPYHVTRTPDPVTYIPFDTFRQTLPNQTKNHFIQYLKTLFPRETVKKLIIDFFIGASNHWPGATIFWQIDKNEKIRSGQIILFDKETGKRIKKPYPHITWVHSLLIKKGKLKYFNLQQCLFGEHQLIENPMTAEGQMTNDASSQSEKPMTPKAFQPVALVESAKTAIIMTGYYPDYIWMATNGSANLNPTILKPLQHRNIILYPDLGQFEKWNIKAIELQKQGFKITTSNLLEINSTPEDHKSGLDIADYFINNPVILSNSEGSCLLPTSINTSPHVQITKFSNSKKALSKDDTLFNSFVTKYPTILHMVDALGLINLNTNKLYHIVE